jgi:hypothetical protein
MIEQIEVESEESRYGSNDEHLLHASYKNIPA